MKKLCVILAAALVISLAVLGSFILQERSCLYTPHRWHEGNREQVLDDVLENYAYPGASVQTMTEALGEGNAIEDTLADYILQLGGWNDDGSDAVSLAQVRVYDIKTVNGRTTYLAVVYEKDCVVQTVLVSNKKEIDYHE